MRNSMMLIELGNMIRHGKMTSQFLDEQDGFTGFALAQVLKAEAKCSAEPG